MSTDIPLEVSDDIVDAKLSKKIVYCFSRAYKTNIAKKSGNSYSTPQSEAPIKIARNSIFHILDEMPSKCIYEEYQIRSLAGGLKHEINIVTKI